MDDCRLDVFDGIVIDEVEGPVDVVGDVEVLTLTSAWIRMLRRGGDSYFRQGANAK